MTARGAAAPNGHSAERRSVLLRGDRHTAWVVLLALAGCHPDPPPEHLTVLSLTHETGEVRELIRRAALIHTVSGTGVLDLTGPDKQSVVLDLIVVLAPPNHARVQASKFGQPVFDLTVTPAGTFLEADRGGDKSVAAGATAAQVARGLSLLTGGFFNDPATTAHDVGDDLVLTRVTAGQPTVVCHVDRATLVPRRFELLDDAGHVRFTLSLAAYQAAGGGALWPRRVTADSGDKGRAVVTLDDADVNGDVPPTAFDPPTRAERLK